VLDQLSDVACEQLGCNSMGVHELEHHLVAVRSGFSVRWEHLNHLGELALGENCFLWTHLIESFSPYRAGLSFLLQVIG
jgi:hypothetical protein